MNIKPYDTRIQQLFLSAFYKVPRFQRPYSWDKENIVDFWDDIVETRKLGHFIGSMVLYSSKSTNDLFIVDGQQRLTTITIFLAALRDTFAEVGEAALSSGIQGVIERLDISASKRFVLLTETSYPYFQEYVQKHGAPELEIKPSDEEKGIEGAYRYAHERFADIVRNERGLASSEAKKKSRVRTRLQEIRDALLSINLIVIQLDNEDDAYIVFETLNTRGKDLEPKDLIKNLIVKMMPAKSADVDPPKLKWDGIVRELSRSAANLNMSTYLHHYWLSGYDYTPERTLFERVKSKIKKTDASAYLNGLVAGVEHYRRIFEPNNFHWEKEEAPIKRSLQALGIFRVRQPAPLTFSVLRAYKSKRISLKQAREMIASVERFHFLHTAVAGLSSSGGVSKMYAAAARELTNEENEQKRAKQVQEFKAKMRDKSPEKASFMSGFGDLRYSDTDNKDRALIRYILEKWDELIRIDLSTDYGKMTIEHIAPQNPKSGKPAKLYSTIGNLILVSQELNGKLKNKNFSEKKSILLDGGVPLDDIIKNADDWTDTEIKARFNMIGDKIYHTS